MISSVFAMKDSNNISRDLLPVSETVLEENYYSTATMNFMLECHKDLLNAKKEFYTSVLESSDQYAINESFNDIIGKIKKIIQKILGYIESIIKRFSTQLHKFVGSEKYILKKKDDIRKFPSGESFVISGYTFTFNGNVPAIDCIDLSEIKSELQDISDKSVVEKITKVSEINIKLRDERLDEICGKILNTNPVNETSFADEVFSVYRDGQSSETNITISKSDINRALNDFEHYKEKIKEVNRLQNEVVRRYKTLQSQADDIVKRNITPDGSGRLEDSLGSVSVSQDDKDKLIYSLNNFVAALVGRIQKICSLHVQAIAGKLDAYNAATIQDKNILYKALSIVQKDINNTRSMKESYDLSIDSNSFDYTRYSNNRLSIYELYGMNQNQKRLVEECLAISERHIPQLNSIHEDLKMDVKGKFDKLVAFIKNVYEKFLMKMNKFITNDEDFLKKYKDTIIKTKIEEYKLNNMPNYDAGISNITKHQLPHLEVKDIVDLDEEGVRKKVFDQYKGGSDNFTEFCKRYFLCNNEPNTEELSSNKLNMAELYVFCTNAKATLKQLESDRDKFIKETNDIKAKVMNAATAKTESVNIDGITYYYSNLLESFINEDGKTPEGQIAKSDAKTTNTDNAKPSANLSIDGATKNADQEKLDRNNNMKNSVKQDEEKKATDADKQAEENKDKDSKKLEETSNWYLKALQTVCSAKITAFQKIYSEYMKILRYHVSHATGSGGKSGDFSKEEQQEVINALKEYKNANGDGKDTAANKVISLYKAKKMVIDRHDVESLAKKNAKLLEG